MRNKNNNIKGRSFNVIKGIFHTILNKSENATPELLTTCKLRTQLKVHINVQLLGNA